MQTTKTSNFVKDTEKTYKIIKIKVYTVCYFSEIIVDTISINFIKNVLTFHVIYHNI